MRNQALGLLGAAAIAVPMLTASAGATTTITFPSVTTSNNSFFTDGWETMNIIAQSEGIDITGQPVGGFGATSVVPAPAGDGGTNLFWCSDLAETLITGSGNPGTYNAATFTTSNPGAQYPTNPPSPTQASQITSLLYNVEANSANPNELGKLSGSSQSIWSAALQLAIWAVLYDTSTTGYNIESNSQNFYVTGYGTGNGLTAVNDANTILGCVASGTGCPTGWGSDAGFSAINFIATGSSEGGQSVGYLTTTSVPEPPSLALLAAGLLGFALVRRRRA